jgi:lysophospholipase L1-like esterase
MSPLLFRRILPAVLCCAGALLLSVAAPVCVEAAGTPSSMSPDATTVSPRDPRIQYMGRLAFVGDAEAKMGFPGVTIRFAYRGPAPTILLGASSAFCGYNLTVNGWEPVAIRPPEGRSELPLPCGPAPKGGWVVELVRRNENWQGVASFFGLRLPTGCELLAPPPLPKRRLMFIGDSITCGEAIDRVPPELDNTSRMANAPRSYGMLLGRQLGAQVHLVSCGGRGVMRNWKGEGADFDVTAPQFFQRALPDDPAAKWDHSSYTPDAIVIALGQNDLSSGWIDEAAFTAAFANFLADIRKVHPKAAVLFTESPMRSEDPATEDGKKREFQRRCLRSVVAAARKAGDKRVAFAPLHQYPGTPTNAHPVAFQHEQMAAELIGPLRALVGW